jgi:hypothetical protein
MLNRNLFVTIILSLGCREVIPCTDSSKDMDTPCNPDTVFIRSHFSERPYVVDKVPNVTPISVEPINANKLIFKCCLQEFKNVNI